MARPILAIVSPNRNAFSETFISAHKQLIDADIRYYYQGELPLCLEGHGALRSYELRALVRQRVRRKLFYPNLNVDQVCFRDSLVRERVQVVLAEYGTTSAAILPVCQQIGLPLIVHFHGFDASIQSLLDRNRANYQAVFEYARCIIAVSRHMEERLLALGCPRNKLIYNVYGPDDRFFAIEPTDPLPQRFFSVGRFVDKKGPHNTILAFRQALERYPDTELIIAGVGPLWAVCNDLVRYFGIQRNVKLPGVLTPSQIRQQLRQCMAFVQHSVTAPNGDMEGTPVAVLEAAAAALPVIATRHGGIPDIIIDGETGLLVDEHDVDGMAANMCTVLEHPDQAKAFGRAGRRRMRQQFTMAHHIDTLNECVALNFDGGIVRRSESLKAC